MKKLHLKCLIRFYIRLWHKVGFLFGRNSESNYIEYGCREVFSRKAALKILYFLKQMSEISYRNKDKITANTWKGVILKTSKLRPRNDFLEISEKNSSKKWFPTKLNSTAKNSMRAVFQESLALNFKWNALTAGISWQHTHSYLVGIFSRFSVAPFLCTPSVILDFCFNLVASNTVIWASLFSAHRFKLEVEDFIFHAAVFSREIFQTLAWKFLLCVPQKVIRVYIFPNFVLV